MHGISAKDEGRDIVWSNSSKDYATWRSGPSKKFYDLLKAMNLGLPRQSILDIGTGTRIVARTLASQGVNVSASDISEGQIIEARKLAEEANLTIDFRIAASELLPFKSKSYDAIIASQCWLYFDLEKTIPEIIRLLKKDGRLVTVHNCWLPLQDPIAKTTEELVLKHNPAWSASGYTGNIPNSPEWSKKDLEVEASFFFDEDIHFTPKSWSGRIRACRGIGASLTQSEVEAFDREHLSLLKEIGGDSFTIKYRTDAHLFKVRKT